jgi:CO/xanthine dehydrogenase Mo-binding subunit
LRARPVLSSPDIHHFGEPVALVVATTFEEARAAAQLVDVAYAAERSCRRCWRPTASSCVNCRTFAS